jgi:Na+/proline symporter
MLISTVFALYLSNALQAFEIILQIGAGTGLLFILRWFWWRINAWSELSAMLSSFAFALLLEFAWEPMGLPALVFHQKLIISVGLTTITWWIVTLLTKPEDSAVLANFYQKIQPHAVGWRRFLQKEGISTLPSGSLSREISGMIWSCTGVYAFLFGTGKIIMQEWVQGLSLLCIAIACLWWVNRIMKAVFTGN